jgi:protein-disulfide isomerase
MTSSSSVEYFTSSRRITLLLLLILVPAIPALSQSGNRETVVALVNGEPITAAAVDESIAPQLYPLQQQLYALRKVALENLIVRALLLAEAKKKSVSLEELKKELTEGRVEVTKDQVENLYLENAATFASMSPDEAKARLRLDLETQSRMRNFRAAIASLKQTASIAVFLDEPRLHLRDAVKYASRGPEGALIVITEFSDFQCPYCRESQAAIKEVLGAYKDQVRLVFKQLPLDIHAQAFAAAQATICAGEQRKFWEMHDALFSLIDLSDEHIKTTASRLGLTLNEFNACLLSERSKNLVKEDLLEAKRLGINSTPTFLINGKPIRGATSFESFKTSIDRELELVRNRSASTASSAMQEKDDD